MTSLVKPPPSDPYAYWNDPPPSPSPRMTYWANRIQQGWRPNRRIRAMGYDESAHWYGIYIWEQMHTLREELAASEDP